MKTILVIGAGRSSSSLVRYLLQHAETEGWQVRVGDADLHHAQLRVGAHARGTAFQFDINDAAAREKEIAAATLVVSMLPAFMHGAVAKDCVRLGKHLVTASYVSDEMRALDAEAKQKGIILLNEIGLDPGIDHLSAMQVIDRVHEAGGVFESFYSYCGGLVAPESNDNPWGYKFSWNPRNVILAGQGTAQYIANRTYKYLPYNRLFAQAKTVEVHGHGKFDAYANRDSLSYRAPYNLTEIPTMLRGTLRQEGYCAAWNVFVQLGLTDDSWKIKQASQLTYADFVNAFLPAGTGTLRTRLAAFMHVEETDPVIEKIVWTGILSDEKIALDEVSPAQILQHLLEQKWLLKAGDKDMIVMLHQFEYLLNGKKHKLDSSLVVIGENETYTAMAQTVGLPLAIAVRLILRGELMQIGVCIPTTKAIYTPILAELETYGIRFTERKY